MKYFVCLLLVMLAACSKKPQDAPPPQPASVAAAPVPDTWSGKYSGDLIVRITPDHKVTLIEAAEDGCTGDLGVVDGGLMTNRLSENELQLVLHSDPESTCAITIKQAGDVLVVTESGNCAAYHGPTCSFNGTVTRTSQK